MSSNYTGLVVFCCATFGYTGRWSAATGTKAEATTLNYQGTETDMCAHGRQNVELTPSVNKLISIPIQSDIVSHAARGCVRRIERLECLERVGERHACETIGVPPEI